MRTRRLTTVAATLILLVLAACGRSLAPARVVRIDPAEGDIPELVSFPSMVWSGTAPGGRLAAWLSPGAVLVRDDVAFPYLASDGEHVRLEFTRWGARLAGRIVSLDLQQDSAATWLEHAQEADLAGLRWVSLNDSPEPVARAALARLAAANPHVGLALSGGEVSRTLPLFRPLALSISDSAASISAQLARQPQIEILYLAIKDSASLDVLRRLPHLRQLMVDGSSVREADQAQASLEALIVFNATLDVSRLRDLPRLRTLSLSGSRWRNASELPALPRLRTFGFASNTTQAEFAAIIRAHPDLEAIELMGVDSVTDLSPLRGARQLKAVALGGRFRNLDVLRDLTSLRFVGFSKEMWDDSPEQVAAIRAALSAADVVVVQVIPLCLGSGWILLLVPAAALTMLAARRTRRA